MTITVRVAHVVLIHRISDGKSWKLFELHVLLAKEYIFVRIPVCVV